MSNSETNESGPRIDIVVVGTDDAGQPFHEKLPATIGEGGKYSLSLARPLRVWDCVRIEFPTRAGEQPRGIAARVTWVQEGTDPAGPRTIHLQPEGMIEGTLPAPSNLPPPPVPPPLGKSEAPVPQAAAPAPVPPKSGDAAAPPPVPPEKTAPPPVPFATPPRPTAAPPPAAESKGPLLDAVRAEATAAVSRDLLRQLIGEAHTVSVEVGRKIIKELTDHSAGLAATLSGEAQNHAKQIQARADELQQLWNNMRATLERERTALDELHRSRLQAFREATDAHTADAGRQLRGFRHAQTEQQRAIEAHLQQTVYATTTTAGREAERKMDGLVSAATARARAEIDALEAARERSWRERTASLQGNLENFLARWEAGLQGAEAALQSLQVATQQAQAAAASPVAKAPAPEPQPQAPAPAETFSVTERIQQSLAAARATFRESLAEISRVLEQSLQANKFPT